MGRPHKPGPCGHLPSAKTRAGRRGGRTRPLRCGSCRRPSQAAAPPRASAAPFTLFRSRRRAAPHPRANHPRPALPPPPPPRRCRRRPRHRPTPLCPAGKDGGSELEFPLDKKSILIGRCAGWLAACCWPPAGASATAYSGGGAAMRGYGWALGTPAQAACLRPICLPHACSDHSCDIRIVNKEISRKHAEVYVEDSGAVRGRRGAGEDWTGPARACLGGWMQAAGRAGTPGSRLQTLSRCCAKPTPRRCLCPAWGGSRWWSTAPP